MAGWDGIERRHAEPEHENMVLLHEEKFGNLEARILTLEVDLKAHLVDAGKMCIKIEKHEQTMDDLKQLRWWLMGTIVTIIGAVMIWLVSWGAITTQIKINTDRINYLEILHPRVADISK